MPDSSSVDQRQHHQADQAAQPETTVGRASSNDIVITHQRVSRFHAVLMVDGPFVTIKDLASSNGVYVNDIKVETQHLVDGDSISIGGCRIALSGRRPGSHKDRSLAVLTIPGLPVELASQRVLPLGLTHAWRGRLNLRRDSGQSPASRNRPSQASAEATSTSAGRLSAISMERSADFVRAPPYGEAPPPAPSRQCSKGHPPTPSHRLPTMGRMCSPATALLVTDCLTAAGGKATRPAERMPAALFPARRSPFPLLV